MASVALLPLENVDQLVDVAFSFDSSFLGALYSNGIVVLFEIDENKQYKKIFTTNPTSRHATAIAFSPLNQGAAFVVGDDSGKIFLYQKISSTKLEIVTSFNHHKYPINALEFAPNSLTFAAASSDGSISITSLNGDTWIPQTIRISDSPATSVSFSTMKCMQFIERANIEENVKLVAAAADGCISIFSQREGVWALEGEQIRVSEAAVNVAKWRPFYGFERAEIAIASENGIVQIWTNETGSWTFTNVCTCNEPPNQLKWSSNGFLLSVGTGQSTVTVYREVEPRHWVILTQ